MHQYKKAILYIFIYSNKKVCYFHTVVRLDKQWAIMPMSWIWHWI